MINEMYRKKYTNRENYNEIIALRDALLELKENSPEKYKEQILSLGGKNLKTRDVIGKILGMSGRNVQTFLSLEKGYETVKELCVGNDSENLITLNDAMLLNKLDESIIHKYENKEIELDQLLELGKKKEQMKKTIRKPKALKFEFLDNTGKVETSIIELDVTKTITIKIID